MKCSSCRKAMARDWQYCPYCGCELGKPGSNFFDGVEKLVKNMVNSSISKELKTKNFSIKFKAIPLNIDEGRVINVDNKKPSTKLPSKILEPETNIKNFDNEQMITINMPGIRSISDVEISHLGESLEVRSSINGKGYFKIISVPDNFLITDKSVSKGVLTIKMEVKK